MGKAMSHLPENGWNYYFHPEVTPGPYDQPTFDPNLGFPNGRKERVMLASEDEMKSAKIKLVDRDYCAHTLINYKTCRKDKWPFPVFCSHEKHIYLNCLYDDFVLRMKEYERERRLRVREHKLKKMQLAA